jgi:cell division protein FtsX
MSDRDRLDAMEATLNIIVWIMAICMVLTTAALIAWWV